MGSDSMDEVVGGVMAISSVVRLDREFAFSGDSARLGTLDPQRHASGLEETPRSGQRGQRGLLPALSAMEAAEAEMAVPLERRHGESLSQVERAPVVLLGSVGLGGSA